MSKVNPRDRRYSKEHEWVFDGDDGTVTMGITDHAQELLTDIVYVELPEIGKKVKQMDPVAVVESVKSVSDVFSPVTGEVIEVNKKLEENPEMINQDAFGKGWIAKLRMDNPAELEGLMDAAAYEEMIVKEVH
ncbi:MAG: glycine cleavage system protein GcvH [Syntrophales bacterium]|nr:glycine cleavage system protein GcvH [Syntrophales bacterium]